MKVVPHKFELMFDQSGTSDSSADGKECKNCCGTEPSPTSSRNSAARLLTAECLNEADDPFLEHPSCAINCVDAARFTSISRAAHEFASNSLSENSKLAYRADMAHFRASKRNVPCSPASLADYLAEMGETYAVATIQRRLASISKAHAVLGFDNPTRSEVVKATMRGILRSCGTAQREAKPILRDDLFAILSQIGGRAKDQRDRALLLLGFAGAFRRSELVGLDFEDIEPVRQGIVVTLRRSKTDQTRAGRKIGVPFGRTKWCPVQSLNEWLAYAGIDRGSIFRGIDRHGNISEQRLSGESVSIIIKERTAAAGFAPGEYSAHSLRAGLATSAVIAGVNTLSIRRTTGHSSDAMLARYVRIGDAFTDNATSAVL